jgi:CIC family chloride channel protein
MSLKNFFSNQPILKLINSNLKMAIHIALVGVPIGIVVGAAIAAYDYIINTFLWDYFSVSFAPVILSMLPLVGMVLTGIIMKTFKVQSSSMADDIVRAYHDPSTGLDYKTVLPKLAASASTMGFGCSAGMEGASKWLGGAVSAFLQGTLNRIKWARLLHGKIEVTMLAGAAAGISAIFRAPLTGAIMGIESPYKKDLAHEALLHALVASATSYGTFAFFRNAEPYFPIRFHYILNLRDLIYCIPLGVLAGLSSHLFLISLSWFKKFSAIFGRQVLLKYLTGGLLLATISLLVVHLIGEPATLQSGLPVSNRLLAGHYTASACAFIFIAKLLATAITFGMGGVGGLFLPSATIGAALGALCDIYFNPSQPGLFTLVGIAAFTGASYNSLLFSVVFIAEASGNPSLVVPGVIASSVSYLMSAGASNSPSQKYQRKDVLDSLEKLKGENINN